MKQNFVLIHPYCHEVEVQIAPDRNCPNDNAYFMPKYGENTFLNVICGIWQAEKQMNDWIRRYDNAMKGLRYWEAKAKENGRRKGINK